MSRVPNWDPGVGFHQSAPGYSPAMPAAHDQLSRWKSGPALRVEADPLQRSFEPDHLQKERAPSKLRSGASRTVASPPLYLRQRQFQSPPRDPYTPNLVASPYSTPRLAPASNPDLSPRQFFPTYPAYPAYPSPNPFRSSPEPSKFSCQVTPEVCSSQISNPGTSIWSPLNTWECQSNQIGSSPSVTTEPLVVRKGFQHISPGRSASGGLEQQQVPSYNPNAPTFLSKAWTPPPRRLPDIADRKTLSPRKTKADSSAKNVRKSPSRELYSARPKQQSANSFERPVPRSSEFQASDGRSNSPYERPSPPTPTRGAQRYTKPQKGFGNLTRKASRAFTAFSGQRVRKFSDTVKHAFKRDKENCLDSPVFDEWEEDSLVAKEAQGAVSQAHPFASSLNWHSFNQLGYLKSHPGHASSEQPELEAEDRPEAPSSEAEALLIRQQSASFEDEVFVENFPEEHLAKSEHGAAVQVPQPAKSLSVTSIKSDHRSGEPPTAFNLFKDYPANQLPLGLPRLVGRREAYQTLFGTLPTESIYLGGSDTGSDSIERIQRSEPEKSIQESGKGSLRRVSRRLRRRNATVRRIRQETKLESAYISSNCGNKVNRLEQDNSSAVTEKDHSCDVNVTSRNLENLTADSKVDRSASEFKLDCSSNTEKSGSEQAISPPSGSELRKLTSKAFVPETSANYHLRQVIIPPAASRKVSDLRAKFEHVTEQSVTSFPKKATPDLRFGKKTFVTPHDGERFIGLQKAGEREAAELPPSFLAEHATKLSPFKNDVINQFANFKTPVAQKGFLRRLKNERDQLNQAEAVPLLEVEDEENILAPLPPIPRKSSKRAANLLPVPNKQEHQHYHEITPDVALPSQIGPIRSRSVTPENRISFTHKPTVYYYSDSIYSEDEAQRSQHQTTPETFQQVPKYRTPPDKHPELLVPPLAIRKKDKDSQKGTPSPPAARASLEDPFKVCDSFLGRCLAVAAHPTQMATLHVDAAILSSTKTKAVEDARVMQQAVIENCKKAGRDPPKYVLLELIGKGSFGRVYKGKDVGSGNIVAVKIIDIDESDTLNPRLADTYSDFMKEVNALKILSESKARNINLVIEALPVGKAMWMITEYCGGGSIATLMKPTPTGLKERFIIPILREVAEAVKWVHQAGIIHRDLKCANILITEEGGVQLCDFGVAGIVEGAVDKRSTFIGTPNWMAPELFQGSSYGKEVDIWAFGSMAYEMATGLPPNARSGVTGRDLGPYLKNHIPKLEGSTYSESLKSIIAYCLEVNPSDRPTIEAVQKHNYIYNSNSKYPAASLSELVRAFKMWESYGGTRKSLFMAGGAQASSELFSTTVSDDNWNFSTTAAFDQAVAQDTSARDVINVYGPSVALDTDFSEDTSRPSRSQELRAPRRRPPPEALAPLKGPLEKLFDPNTISTYEENSRSHYNQYQNNIPDIPSIDIQSIPSREVSDLPLRDVTNQTSIRDTLIDLDVYDVPSGLPSFTGMDTIRPTRQASYEGEGEYDTGGYHDFHRPALSDPLDNPNRRTQDWKFPVMAPPASAAPDMTRFPATYEPHRPTTIPATGARPTLAHHATEPISLPTQSSSSLLPSAPASPNRMSLIDLDLSVPEPSRPSTADSSVSQEMTSANPFHLEGHASLYHPSAREPSLYVSEDLSRRLPLRGGNTLQDLVDQSDLSASDAEGPQYDHFNGHTVQSYENGTYVQPEYDVSAAGHFSDIASSDAQGRSSQPYTMAHFPDLPPPPSAPALSGSAAHNEMIEEMHRMLGGLTAQLESFRDVYETQIRAPARRGAFMEEE